MNRNLDLDLATLQGDTDENSQRLAADVSDSGTLGDFPVGWEVLWAEDRRSVETIRKVKLSGAEQFRSPEEAEAYKAELQASGYIASMRPIFRTHKDRDRMFKRRQLSLADQWPLQARPPTRK